MNSRTTLAECHHPETVIKSDSGWFTLNLRELFAYRDLLRLLVWRDFVAKYRQTIFGPLWFVLQPLLTTAVFVVVFAKVMKVSTDGIPPILFYLTGLLGWHYFAQTFTQVSSTFLTHAQLFGKVYFPRAIVPLASTIGGIWAVLLNAVILCLFIAYFSLQKALETNVGLHLLYFPLIVLQIACIALGAGLWMAVLTAKYRDLSHMIGFLTQILLYATPVIYPLSQVKGTLRRVAEMNPMAFPLEALKEVFLGTSSVNASLGILSISITVGLLVTGALAFQHTQRSFIDTV